MFAAAEVEQLDLTQENVEKVLDEVCARFWDAFCADGCFCDDELKAYHPPPLPQVRPYLMSDGGNVEFVEIDGLVVRLRLQGACGSCPSSLTTMTMGIKRRLMEKIPVGARVLLGMATAN